MVVLMVLVVVVGGGGGGGGVSVSRKGVLHAAKHVDAFRFKHSFSGMHEHAQA